MTVRYSPITVLIVLSLLIPSVCLSSEETITGHYCYTYGDRETLQEAREVTRTLSIRNGIESYRVFIESSTNVKNFSLTNDLVQIISSGYLKNVKVVEHTEEGRTICEKISGTVIPEQIEKVLKREVEKRTKTIEEGGIDSNRYFKILRIYDQYISMDFSKVHVVCSVSSNINCPDVRDKPELQVFITYYDKDGNPGDSNRVSLCEGRNYIYRNEIIRLPYELNFSFNPNQHPHYKVWLYHDPKTPISKQKPVPKRKKTNSDEK